MKTKPTEEEIRDMLDKGMTLYQISRKYNTTIPVIFQLEKYYDIISQYSPLEYYRSISKEDIESMYIGERMTQRQIADEIGCSRGHVGNILGHYHIQARLNGKYTPKQRASKINEIIRLHNDEHLTQEEIAEKVGYSQAHVYAILKEHGVQTRPGGKYTPQQRAYISDEIVQRYNNGETQEEIAEKVGYSIGNVGIILHERGVQTRVGNGTITHQEMSSITADKIQECIDKGMDQSQIAEHFGVSEWKIFDLAEEFDISGMVNNFRITNPEYQSWKYAVLDRCYRTCQLCGKTGVHLEVHHIIPWADAPELRYNVDNGVPLCHGCHYKVTGHEYEYAQYFLDITQPQYRDHEIIESMPWEPPLELHSIIDYPDEEV